MKDQFSTPSVQDWIQKAEKDLKGKSLDDLTWSWGDSLSMAPAYFDAPADDFKLHISDNPWAIGEHFTVTHPSQNNKDILEALNMGLEHLHLSLSTPLSKSDWTTLFDKVILNYISLSIDFKDDNASVDTLADYLNDTEWNPSQINIIANHGITIPNILKECLHAAVDIHIQTDSPAQQLAMQIRQAEQTLIDHQASQKLIFNIHLSKSFYHNIAWVQAIQILWQNVLDAHQLDPLAAIHMVAHIQDQSGLDENTQKINATTQAISAVVCGVRSLVIHPLTISENQGFERRINRNIQHLLKLESYMHLVMNPTEGSYYFDHITKELAEQAWTHFQDLA